MLRDKFSSKSSSKKLQRCVLDQTEVSCCLLLSNYLGKGHTIFYPFTIFHSSHYFCPPGEGIHHRTQEKTSASEIQPAESYSSPQSPKMLSVQPAIGWVAQLCFPCTSWLLLPSSFSQCINRFLHEAQQCPWPQKAVTRLATISLNWVSEKLLLAGSVANRLQSS